MKILLLLFLAAPPAAASTTGVCAARGAERTETLHTLRLQGGLHVMPCAASGLAHFMTYETARRFIAATGLTEAFRPLLDRASDPDNPDVNRDRARLGRAASSAERCLRKRSLLPPIPPRATPLAEYLFSVRLALRGHEADVKGCLREDRP